MARYTALDDPIVDKVIEGHLQRIVDAITARMKPQSIVLRGSFGRGEGSVMLKEEGLYFISDYEIDVTCNSPFYRSLFADLSKELSAEFGMQVGIRWMRPDCLTADRIGPFTSGPAPKSISLYEFRYGSKILWGEDFISGSLPIDPDQIPLRDGMKLILNRMAESLFYMSLDDNRTDESLVPYHWINKTILACAECLLLHWKEYHYSYEERGRRFARLAVDHLDFMGAQKETMIGLVNRATDFKLRPRTDIYQDNIHDTWNQVIPACDSVFRYLMSQGFDISFENFADYPHRFLNWQAAHSPHRSDISFWQLKLLEVYRAISAHRHPQKASSEFEASDIVYSAVPLLFFGYASEKDSKVLAAARHWLGKLERLEAPSTNQKIEWDYLRQVTTKFWKVYCY